MDDQDYFLQLPVVPRCAYSLPPTLLYLHICWYTALHSSEISIDIKQFALLEKIMSFAQMQADQVSVRLLTVVQCVKCNLILRKGRSAYCLCVYWKKELDCWFLVNFRCWDQWHQCWHLHICCDSRKCCPVLEKTMNYNVSSMWNWLCFQ